jgi:hypothetical protein
MSVLLWGLARHVGDEDDGDDDQHRLGLWSLPTVRLRIMPARSVKVETNVGCWGGQEVVVHALSFVANPLDLCSVSLVQCIMKARTGGCHLTKQLRAWCTCRAGGGRADLPGVGSD